ncbi:MAG: histidine decarboxylase [Flavobacteriia bacterium]|nr:histidine decarboxylase [Flavobacteriia bacterium]
MSHLAISERLKLELERLIQKNEEYIGYPLTKNFDYQVLAPFLNLQINNVGDPFTTSSLGIDTKNIEKEVIGFFTHLLNASKNDVWGYVTNGGSEGNLYGLYLAREAFPNGMVYYSESTHYSVKKNLHLLNMQNIVIRAQDNGEIDYTDLESSITSRRHQPAIFFLNIGSTMKEAVDNLASVKKIIKKLALKNYYIHCDAALLGMIAPFHIPKPLFDFKEGIDSISISGHKFIGSPIPCGIVLCKNSHKERIGSTISYVDTKDTTITGSRNGLTPLILWYALKKMGLNGLKNNVEKSIALAKYTEEKLTILGVNAWRNTNAITVVFDKPSSELCKKFQLATEDSISHIICMPGIDKTQIDHFIEAYQSELEQKKDKTPLQIVQEEELLWPEYF